MKQKITSFSKQHCARLKFLAKAVPLTLVVYLFVMYLGARFTIGIDPQKNICLGNRVYVIDHYDRRPVRGKPFQFKARHMNPYFKDGTLIVKLMNGIPGDRVKVSDAGVTVNGATLAVGLPLLQQLKKPASRFTRDEYLADGNFWFMGTSEDSYDSRYWGTVQDEQIIGRAYGFL